LRKICQNVSIKLNQVQDFFIFFFCFLMFSVSVHLFQISYSKKFWQKTFNKIFCTNTFSPFNVEFFHLPSRSQTVTLFSKFYCSELLLSRLFCKKTKQYLRDPFSIFFFFFFFLFFLFPAQRQKQASFLFFFHCVSKKTSKRKKSRKYSLLALFVLENTLFCTKSF